MGKKDVFPQSKKKDITKDEYDKLNEPYEQQKRLLGWLEECSEKAAFILHEYGCTTIKPYGTKELFPQKKV